MENNLLILILKFNSVMIYINFFILIFLIYFNWKHIKKVVLKIDKKIWIILGIILVIALCCRFMIPTPSYRLMTDEHIYILQGKEIINNFGERNLLFVNDKMPLGWSQLISLIIYRFGLGSGPVFYFSIILGSLTAVNVFLITYLITKKTDLSLISALMFSLLPTHILHSASAGPYVPSLFFSTLSIVFCLMFFLYKKNVLHWLSVVGIAYAFQIRSENIILIPLYIIGILFFNKKAMRLDYRFILPWIVLIILITPSFVQQYERHIGNENFIENFNKEFPDQYIITESFGFKNLRYNSLTYGKYIFNSFFHPMIITMLLLIGSIYFVHQKPKEAIFIGIWFGLLWSILFFSAFQINGMATEIDRKTRLLLCFYPIIVLIAVYGIKLYQDIVKKVVKNKNWPLAFIIIMIIISFIPYTYLARNNSYPLLELIMVIPKMVEKDVPQESLVVLNAPEILEATTEIHTISTYDFLEYPPDRNKEKELYFFDGYMCTLNSFNRELCTRMKNEFNMSIFKEYEKGEIKYTLYRLS